MVTPRLDQPDLFVQRSIELTDAISPEWRGIHSLYVTFIDTFDVDRWDAFVASSSSPNERIAGKVLCKLRNSAHVPVPGRSVLLKLNVGGERTGSACNWTIKAKAE